MPQSATYHAPIMYAPTGRACGLPLYPKTIRCEVAITYVRTALLYTAFYPFAGGPSRVITVERDFKVAWISTQDHAIGEHNTEGISASQDSRRWINTAHLVRAMAHPNMRVMGVHRPSSNNASAAVCGHRKNCSRPSPCSPASLGSNES